MIGHEMVAMRNAIEALRTGVPNRAAIRLLGTSEEALSHDFVAGLRRSTAASSTDEQVEGIGISGYFGTGKSHQLGYFAELAQQENFIVSLVPISKETPLFDPARLFAAAVRAAVVPGENDDVMTAALRRLFGSRERYDTLEDWTISQAGRGRLSSLFPALLHLIPRIHPDDHARIARFLGGAKLNVNVVKSWLRAAGAAKLFDLKRVREADLAVQRLRFAPRMFCAAGFAGWCILLDEVELIGRYSPLQRGRSYAELVRWLGLDREENVPGIIAVAAITADFEAEMFDRKRDDELVPPRLEKRGSTRQAAMARQGIAWLRQSQRKLEPPNEAQLRRSFYKISTLYRDAYDWMPPDSSSIGERRTSASMRQYVKSWITTWDIERLYGEVPEIETGTIATNYDEDIDIEQALAAPDQDDGKA